MSEDTVDTVSSLWPEVKALVAAAEVDVLKSMKGNSSAAVRARKALRLLKQKTAVLVRCTVAEGKARKAAKPPRVKKQK